MSNLQVWEVLKNCQNAKSDERRIAILKENAVQGVGDVLKIVYDKRITLLLPPTPPPFKKNVGSNPSNLHQASVNGIYKNFVRGYNQISQAKREMIFIQFLETLCEEEVEIVLGLIVKKLPSRYGKITEEIVRAAYPTLLHPVEVPQVPLEEKSFVPRLDSQQ